MHFLSFVGWVGSMAFAISSLPQVIWCVKHKHARGITWGLLFLSLVGEICSMAYLMPYGFNPLIINYASNLVLTGIIIYYKYTGGDKQV